jgi:hypothetical protein
VAVDAIVFGDLGFARQPFAGPKVAIGDAALIVGNNRSSGKSSRCHETVMAFQYQVV